MFMDRSILVLLFVVLGALNLPATAKTPSDSVEILLMDKDVQIDATQAVNDMYNFKFEKAERQFRWLAQDYPDHPLPYFLLGLSQWWRMAPNIDDGRYDGAFMQYIDQSLDLAHKMYDKNPENVEASFFLAAGYGFKGRLLAERKSWRKAASAGRNALKYLENSSNQSDLSPEFLFGDALYNYYSVWIPDNYPILKPLLVFFKKGNKELGIKQLQEVAGNAFYTRTEAQSFLMRILAIEEQELMRAMQVSQYLAETFPDNSYFHRFYARLLYTTGKHWQAEKESLRIIEKIDSGKVGYGPVTGRYAGFFLGQIYTHKGKFDRGRKVLPTSSELCGTIGRPGIWLLPFLSDRPGGYCLPDRRSKRSQRLLQKGKKRRKEESSCPWPSQGPAQGA